jgi:hypothetical protein
MRRNLDTALFALMALMLAVLLWRDVTRPQLTAADIAFAVSDPDLCKQGGVKPAELEP